MQNLANPRENIILRELYFRDDPFTYEEIGRLINDTSKSGISKQRVGQIYNILAPKLLAYLTEALNPSP